MEEPQAGSQTLEASAADFAATLVSRREEQMVAFAAVTRATVDAFQFYAAPLRNRN